jgi:hypothetical protein
VQATLIEGLAQLHHDARVERTAMNEPAGARCHGNSADLAAIICGHALSLPVMRFFGSLGGLATAGPCAGQAMKPDFCGITKDIFGGF